MINKKQENLFNLFILILTVCFMVTLFFSKGTTLHLDCIALIPLFIFIITLIYISYYIFKDCKYNNSNAKLYSILNILLSPFFIGLIYYLFKRRSFSKERKNKKIFKIFFYFNVILSIFSSSIMICFVLGENFNNNFLKLILTYINGFLFVTFPLLTLLVFILLIILIALTVTKYGEKFLIKISFLLLIINITPVIIIFIGFYFWTCI